MLIKKNPRSDFFIIIFFKLNEKKEFDATWGRLRLLLGKKFVSLFYV